MTYYIGRALTFMGFFLMLLAVIARLVGQGDMYDFVMANTFAYIVVAGVLAFGGIVLSALFPERNEN